MSLGLVANMYQEARALPGWLEMAARCQFDDICVYHTGPQGAYSTDGTIELLEQWGVRIVYGAIDAGFGVVRTQAVRHSTCDWVMILDADERFHPFLPVLVCEDLRVRMEGEPYNQMAWLRGLLNTPDIQSVCTIRRHWHDLTFQRPTQNWHQIPDAQLRIVRNIPEISYSEFPKMHERILDARTGGEPTSFRPNQTHGPFFDHYHCWFKPMEPDQRQHDIRIYDALDQGRPVPAI